MIDLNCRIGNEEATASVRDSSAATVTMWATIALGALTLLVLGVVLSRGISKVLKALVGETARLTQAAVQGKLQTRGEADLVNAEFRPIIEGMNATLDVVVGFLDQIPAPAMIISKELDVLYMNDFGSRPSV